MSQQLRSSRLGISSTRIAEQLYSKMTVLGPHAAWLDLRAFHAISSLQSNSKSCFVASVLSLLEPSWNSKARVRSLSAHNKAAPMLLSSRADTCVSEIDWQFAIQAVQNDMIHQNVVLLQQPIHMLLLLQHTYPRFCVILHSIQKLCRKICCSLSMKKYFLGCGQVCICIWALNCWS